MDTRNIFYITIVAIIFAVLSCQVINPPPDPTTEPTMGPTSEPTPTPTPTQTPEPVTPTPTTTPTPTPVDDINPDASFMLRLGSGWPLSGEVTVDASTVSDNITPTAELQVRWDWENDSIWDTTFSTAKAVTHIYTSTGTKSITLEVKDNAGNTSTITHQIVIEAYLQWGSNGTGDGQFKYPTGLAVDSSRNVFIVDCDNYRIQEFNSSGSFIRKWGSQGSGDGEFYVPFGVAVDLSGDVYVADQGNERIQKFNWSGAFILKWGSLGSANGQFDDNCGIAVDSTGNVYVAERENNRIQKFDSMGNFILQWGINGTGNGEFNWPLGVAVDSLGNIYVVDYNNHRIQKFGLLQ
jgi:hypothetical protein